MNNHHMHTHKDQNTYTKVNIFKEMHEKKPRHALQIVHDSMKIFAKLSCSSGCQQREMKCTCVTWNEMYMCNMMCARFRDMKGTIRYIIACYSSLQCTSCEIIAWNSHQCASHLSALCSFTPMPMCNFFLLLDFFPGYCVGTSGGRNLYMHIFCQDSCMHAWKVLCVTVMSCCENCCQNQRADASRRYIYLSSCDLPSIMLQQDSRGGVSRSHGFDSYTTVHENMNALKMYSRVGENIYACFATSLSSYQHSSLHAFWCCTTWLI